MALPMGLSQSMDSFLTGNQKGEQIPVFPPEFSRSHLNARTFSGKHRKLSLGYKLVWGWMLCIWHFLQIIRRQINWGPAWCNGTCPRLGLQRPTFERLLRLHSLVGELVSDIHSLINLFGLSWGKKVGFILPKRGRREKYKCEWMNIIFHVFKQSLSEPNYTANHHHQFIAWQLYT